MKAGDTFHIPQPGTSLDSHLWVILSDPVLDDEHILIVNFTTLHRDVFLPPSLSMHLDPGPGPCDHKPAPAFLTR